MQVYLFIIQNFGQELKRQKNYWIPIFSLLIDLFQITLDQIEKHDILLGKLSAADNNVKLNIYYTPIELTHNALIFNNKTMKEWWEKGFDYVQNKTAPTRGKI